MNNEQNKPQFVPGLILAEGFFHEVVKPILRSHYADLRYSAALIGSGSEVLEFDSEMSTDHHWGPRVMLFLNPADFKGKRNAIHTVLSNELPRTYMGYPTNFSQPDPDDNGTQLLQTSASGPINHRVEMYTLDGFFCDYIGISINEKLKPIDWLTLPHQKLRSITAGRVFHDDLGLEKIRVRFSWYPHDVWLYILASGWARIDQEEHLMGRAGFVNDEIGSSLISSRLIRDIMRLAFLMEKNYPPYAKWFGTAFSRLKSAKKLTPILTNALHAISWKERESHLCSAYGILAKMHNNLKITEPVSPEVTQFWGRPFRVIKGERFVQAIIKKINDPEIISLTKRKPFGSIDLYSDNTDFLEDPSIRTDLKAIYK